MLDNKESTKSRTPKGIAIETVGYLVLAVIALVLLWVFLSRIAPHITDAVSAFAHEIICKICDELIGNLALIFCWGC